MPKTNFHEIQFPSDISYGATGGPEFLTDVITSSSGFEQRNINWIQARSRYNLSPAIKTQEQLEYILSFFRLCQGKAIGFRFKDWSDYKIKKQQISTANGKIKEFQLIKTYNCSGIKTIRQIQKPLKIKIYCNEHEVETKVDSSCGKIIFDKAPLEGSIIKAEGEFDVPVRFDTDYLPTSLESYKVYGYQEIPLLEIKI